MSSMSYITTAGDTMESYTAENRSGNNNGGESVFSPLAPSFHSRNASEMMNLPNPQEPRTADTGLSSANNYVSMLTREQLSVLRSIRPSLLYEYLQEVVNVRRDKRMRRALPNECGFCKNNGENEEWYSSHVLKDWCGSVLCPVLRAFHCPRCGATGDRAHTIKYCPDNANGGLERSEASRRVVLWAPRC